MRRTEQGRGAVHVTAVSPFFGLARFEKLEATVRNDDAVGCREHFGTEEGFNLTDDHVHSKCVLLESSKAVDGEFRDFACLNHGVVVGTLGKDGEHIPLGDENLHDAGVNGAENGLGDDGEIRDVSLFSHFCALESVLHFEREAICKNPDHK